MNNSNIVYSIATSYNRMLAAPLDISVTSLTSKSTAGTGSFMRRDLDTRQAPTPAPAPAAPAKPNLIVLVMSNAIDTVAGWVGAKPTGGIPTTLKKMASVSVTDVQDGFGEFYLKTKNKVLADVSTTMANYLTEVAAGYKASATTLLGGTAPKVAATIQGRAVRQLSTYTDFSMTAEEADVVMEALLKEIKHPELAANLAREMPQVIANLNASSARDAMFTSQKSVKDGNLDKPFFSSSPIAPLQGALITAGPTLVKAMKTTALRGMNAGMRNVKKAVPVYDWYTFYPGHMCWGFYKHERNSGKITEELVGCGTTATWKDINLAPIVQKLLNKTGIKAQAPPEIGVGNGLEKSFEGLRKFTGLIYSTGVLTIVNLTFALIATLLAIGATGFVTAKMVKTIYFATISICVSAMFLAYSSAIIITASLGGVAYIMPGTGEALGAIVNIGGGFLAVLWINFALTFTGTMAWIVMWLGLVREGEFEKGKVEGVAIMAMVNGHEFPKHG
ncbi:hypothetical protein E2P81_ATG00525 [Venturia nashicola]|uniref:Uncharacterized protein n=1 Tax=Venturia nashicola TaxID=86259 RepID=A0A4Z1PFQ1_9PEZI|nr:hypothetical protein E6O75_ATG00540 [Venturia nashicola]TLD39538.1 hypothetical protein E2P81_ATG00525 [Venturia nashicola]